MEYLSTIASNTFQFVCWYSCALQHFNIQLQCTALWQTLKKEKNELGTAKR